MRIGPIEVTRLRRDAEGELVRPWQMVTLDQLSDEARALISKMARAANRDFHEELREQLLEELREQIPALLREQQIEKENAA